MKTKIKVPVADDHELVRTGLASLIDFEDDMTCVGTAKNGQLALGLAAHTEPDVVVMDLVMPVLGGVEATEKIIAAQPDVKVLILTSYGSSDDLRRALGAGATGALLKSAPNREVLKAIRRLAAGERVIAPEIESQLKSEPPPPELDERQLEILRSITRGLSNQDIATQLGISRGSVKKHLAVIFEKLGAATRAEAASMALRNHLLKF